MPSRFGTGGLDEAYDRCGIVTASYAKTFYLGTQLMTPEKAKAVWAVYVWCRRTDELVDGPNASRITPEVSRAAVCVCCSSWKSCNAQQYCCLKQRCQHSMLLALTYSRAMLIHNSPG